MLARWAWKGAGRGAEIWESGKLEFWETGELGNWGTGELLGGELRWGTAGDNADRTRSGCDREALGNQFRFMFLFNHHSLRMEQIKLSRTGQESGLLQGDGFLDLL